MIKSRGSKEVIASLQNLSEQAAKQVEQTMREKLTRLLPIINEGTAVKTGFLVSRNQVRVRKQGLKVVGEVFNDAPYALQVHERPTDKGPGGKFIERVLYDHAREIGESIGKDQLKMLDKISKERRR